MNSNPFVIGVLSGFAGPVSLPFVAGYHLNTLEKSASTDAWSEIERGIFYGIGYYLSQQLMDRAVGPLPS